MNKHTTQQEDIDFVILWVDGSDPEWRKQKKEYSHDSDDDDRPERYREFGTLKYLFRGIDKYAPWVRKIHFVTWGHLPNWLDTSHPKLHIVNHKDYMPADYLPVFNSDALELNLHRIDGLSERFVYFNDDMLMIDHIKPEDFFIDGKPVDMLALQPVVANPENPIMSRIFINNSLLICKYFDKRTQMKKLKSKYFHIGYPLMYWIYNCLELAFPLFTGFYTVHGASPVLKSTFETLWSKEGELLDEVSRHRFRSRDDVNQYIFREWQKQTGNFVPVNLHRFFCYLDIAKNFEKSISIIRKQKRKMICLNDPGDKIDFVPVSNALCSALDSIMPEPSSFEIFTQKI